MVYSYHHFLIGIFLTFSDYRPDWLNGKMLKVFISGQMKNISNIINVNFTNTIIELFTYYWWVTCWFSKEKYEDEFISKFTSMIMGCPC